MPDTRALQEAFGQPTNQAEGYGLPVARLLALFHAGTGMLQSFLVSPLQSHEMARVSLLHPELGPGDVLVGDRAFGTFAHLALLAGRGLHGLFRMAQRRVVDFTLSRDTAIVTILQILACGSLHNGGGRDAVDDTDLLAAHFDPFHQGADYVPAWLPIEVVQFCLDPLGELL